MPKTSVTVPWYLGKINAFKAKEQSGLDIQSFKADFFTEKRIFLKIYT
jgi:hypothetical protein